jgi:hypothetical protein
MKSRPSQLPLQVPVGFYYKQPFFERAAGQMAGFTILKGRPDEKPGSTMVPADPVRWNRSSGNRYLAETGANGYDGL